MPPGTQELYTKAIADLAAYYRRASDRLTPEEIRTYLHYLLAERKLAWSTCNITASAMRFFYVETLGWSEVKLHLPPRPAPHRLPQVLSLAEVERLLTGTRNPKHRALLMTTYAAGLRVSEVVHLRVSDIESAPERMLIRVHQGKAGRSISSGL